MSLRRRLLLALVPLFIAALVAVDVATYLALQGFLVSKVDEQILSVHRDAEQALFGAQGGFFPRGGPQGFNSLPPGLFVEVVSSDGAVVDNLTRDFLDPSGDDAITGLALPSGLSAPSYVTARGSSGADFRAYVDTATGPGGGTLSGDLLIVALPLDDTEATLRQLLVLELVAGGAITLIVLAVTWLVVRGGLRPLERMGHDARAAASDLSIRVGPASDSTEVGRLGNAINAMLAELERAFNERAANERRLRHFVSDASHELRTPLTSMRGYAELLRRNPVMSEADVMLATRRIEEETQRMGVLVDDLLLLARLDQGRPLESAPVDLDVLVSDACADAHATDPDRPITAVIDEPVRVLGDDLRLRQVLGNVVRNAIVHTPPSTPVEVHLAVDRGTAVVDVVDHGPGIQGDRARIFERFHRADPDRSRDQGGSGLGLSIVAAVVAAHRGRIEVRDTPGGGATFHIELPGAEVTADSQPRRSTL